MKADGQPLQARSSRLSAFVIASDSSTEKQGAIPANRHLDSAGYTCNFLPIVQLVMVTGKATPRGIGIELIGKADEMKHFGQVILQIADTLAEPESREIVTNFGLAICHARRKTPPKRTKRVLSRLAPPVKKPVRYVCAITWPRFLYCLNVLQQRQTPAPAVTHEETVIRRLRKLADAGLNRWQPRCQFPITIWTHESLQFYQGTYATGLLIMAELAWVRRKPGPERMDYLNAVIDIVYPLAWIHHDTLAFVANTLYGQRDAYWITRADLEGELGNSRW